MNRGNNPKLFPIYQICSRNAHKYFDSKHIEPLYLLANAAALAEFTTPEESPIRRLVSILAIDQCVSVRIKKNIKPM